MASSLGDRPTTPTYYELLGLHPSASVSAIRKAYHELSKQYHPDTTTLPYPIATAKFQQLNLAYTTLLSPDQRLAYNQSIGYSHLPVIQSWAQTHPSLSPHSAQPPGYSSAYLDPTDRPLSSGELFALLIMAVTLVGCLLLAIAIGILRGPGPIISQPIPTNTLSQSRPWPQQQAAQTRLPIESLTRQPIP